MKPVRDFNTQSKNRNIDNIVRLDSCNQNQRKKEISNGLKKTFVILVLFLFAISGCGYTTKSSLAPHLKTIYVDNVRNKIDITKETEYGDHYRIYRPGLEREMTKAIKDRFIFDGNLKVINSKEDADSVLVCDIVDFKKEPLQYTDNRTVDEYRLKIIINMKFTDLTEGTTLVDEDKFVGEATYTLSGPFAGSESAAQKDAITDLARRIVEEVVEKW